MPSPPDARLFRRLRRRKPRMAVYGEVTVTEECLQDAADYRTVFALRDAAAEELRRHTGDPDLPVCGRIANRSDA